MQSPAPVSAQQATPCPSVVENAKAAIARPQTRQPAESTATRLNAWPSHPPSGERSACVSARASVRYDSCSRLAPNEAATKE